MLTSSITHDRGPNVLWKQNQHNNSVALVGGSEEEKKRERLSKSKAHPGFNLLVRAKRDKKMQDSLTANGKNSDSRVFSSLPVLFVKDCNVDCKLICVIPVSWNFLVFPGWQKSTN